LDEILVTASYGGLKLFQVRYFRLTLQESELLRNKKQESKGTLPCHIVNVALEIEKNQVMYGESKMD
jgi:hypothetical protein